MLRYYFASFNETRADIAKLIGSNFITLDILGGPFDNHKTGVAPNLCATELVLKNGPIFPNSDGRGFPYFVVPEKLDTDAFLALYLNLSMDWLTKEQSTMIANYAHSVDFLTEISDIEDWTFDNVVGNLKKDMGVGVGLLAELSKIMDEIIYKEYDLRNLKEVTEAKPRYLETKRAQLEKHKSLGNGYGLFLGTGRGIIPYLFETYDIVIWPNNRIVNMYLHPTKQNVTCPILPKSFGAVKFCNQKVIKILNGTLDDVLKLVGEENEKATRNSKNSC